MSGYDPFKDSEQEKKDKKRENKRANDLADLKKVLSTAEGKRVLLRVVKATKFFDSSWTGNSGTFFNEGMREVGRFVMDEIQQADPEGIASFFTEAFKKDIE